MKHQHAVSPGSCGASLGVTVSLTDLGSVSVSKSLLPGTLLDALMCCHQGAAVPGWCQI